MLLDDEERKHKRNKRLEFFFHFTNAASVEKQEEGREGAKSESVLTGIKQIVGGGGRAERLMR